MSDPGDADGTPEEAWAQAGRLAFHAVRLLVALLLLAWAVGNIHSVPPESRAVVLRFGEVHRVAGPGLLLAWPTPIERVAFVPAAERRIDQVIERFQPLPDGEEDSLKLQTDADIRRNRGYLLTGDMGVTRLDATVTYQIVDPVAYLIAQKHVPPALERLFVSSATAVCAGRNIDALVAIGASAGEPAEQQADASEERARLRTDLVKAVNARLQALEEQGTGLGIEVARVDLTASLPLEAKAAFDAVLQTQQRADQFIATARSYATQIAQQAEQQADRQLHDAEAVGSERVAKATSATAAISALAQRDFRDPGDTEIALQLYRERMARLLERIGQVTAIDPRDGGHTILPGPGQ